MSNTTGAVDIGEKSKLRRDGEERGGRNYFSVCSNVIASQTCKVCAVYARTDPYCCFNISIIGPSAAQSPPAELAPGRGTHRTGSGGGGARGRNSLCATRRCAQPPPRSGGLALIHLRQVLIPGRGAARLQQPAGTAPLPGRGRRRRACPAAVLRGAGAARKRGKLGVSAGRRRTLLGFAQVAASPRFGLGVGSLGGGDAESRALLAMVLGECSAGCSLLPQLQRETRGEDPVPQRAQQLCPVRGNRGTAEKLPPAGGSHQIASLLGAPLKPRTWSPKLMIAGAKKRGACGELDSAPAQ
ncbi:uncharacterized protein LOC143694392 [Agelaius phoeniceus]|uniref:uncharacterized protein LOC143694392 n=1 Tax=Agelaius phoeniceus TaxID=39638 RepID=UPI004054BD77